MLHESRSLFLPRRTENRAGQTIRLPAGFLGGNGPVVLPPRGIGSGVR